MLEYSPQWGIKRAAPPEPLNIPTTSMMSLFLLAQDEALAIELNDILQGRLRTALYLETKEQSRGSDGEKVSMGLRQRSSYYLRSVS